MGEVVQAPTVRVVSVSRVSPSSLTQHQEREGVRVKLSYLDVSWVCLPAVQHLLLYDLGDNGEFPVVVSRLRAALADTLTHYLPCAGRLEYEAETGDIVVDCSDEPGVAFVEADANSMDVRRLAAYDRKADDMVAFVSLVPELDSRVLPAPVMSVQVTRLGTCGLAVGMSMHHAVADGRTMWRFMEAWASSSREGSPCIVGPPVYCRDAVQFARDDDLAREWLNIAAPNLPVVSSAGSERDSLLRLARWTFHLGADGIRFLKRRIDTLATAATAGAPNKPKPVSTFVALAALCWTAFVRSKGFVAGDDTYLCFLADLHTRFDPPVPDAYLGNCIRDCVAGSADAAEITGDGQGGILHAARVVQAVVADVEAAPLPGYDEALSAMGMQLPSSRLAYVVGSPWIQAYQGTDFGFGKPALAVVVSMNNDGEMMLLGGRRDGEVQVSVSIDPAHMATFKACILGYLPTLSLI